MGKKKLIFLSPNSLKKKKKKLIFPPVAPGVLCRRRRLVFFFPFYLLLPHWSILPCWYVSDPVVMKLSRNGGILTSVSDLQVFLGGVVVSRRGWFLGVLAVKSAFGLRSGVDLGFQFLDLFLLWRWERVVVFGCLLSLDLVAWCLASGWWWIFRRRWFRFLGSSKWDLPTFSGSVGLRRFSGDELVVVLAAV